VNFTSDASKADIIPTPKQTLISLLEGYNEEQIKAKAKDIPKKVGIDIALQLRGKYDFEALVGLFHSWLMATGFPYRHNKDLEKDRHTFIIQHHMWRKYSVFASESLKSLFEPLVTKGVEYSTTDNVISITVEG
jgi:hypothetical protein